MTDLADRPVHTHMIPWESMTPRQQAEHLVHMHGFGKDEFSSLSSTTGVKVTDAYAVEAWLEERFTDKTCRDESYPHPEGRTYWHNGDHDGGYHLSVLTGVRRHRHDKAARQ